MPNNEERKNKNSEARIRANNRYGAKAYDRINLAVPKGQKKIIQARADELGKSLNGYVTDLIAEDLKNSADNGEK